MTPSTASTLARADILAALAQHAAGHWGDLPPEELAANHQALRRGDPVLSLHVSSKGRRVWIITEPNRGLTTLILARDEWRMREAR